MRRTLVLLVGLALQVCLTTSLEAQTPLPENIPDFSHDFSRPRVQSVQSGRWSDAATWQEGQVPTSNHVVHILQAHTVTIDDQSAAAYTVSVDGKLAFNPTVNTALYVTNLQVMAGNMGMETPGVLEVGTTDSPITDNVTAKITIANNPLGGGVPDTDQFGTGITVLGKMSMHGSVRTPTFVRLAAEPRAGDTTLTLSEPVSGWRIGDRLVLPDTRHLVNSEVNDWMNIVNQWEELTVQDISPDGITVTLALPLRYHHLGARDRNNVLEFLPHVGNLTRNVVVQSENPAGTRGHMLSIHMAEVDIRYALFRDLGRTTYLPLDNVTNHIGRYPIHMHHLSGPMATPANGYQFTLLGNAVDGGSDETQFKWGITVHGTHYGSIKDNVVYNYNGAAIATEDGSESFNEFDHNFVMRGIGEPDEPGVQARSAMGTEGVGFWFRGPNNYVRNNVAANYQNPTTEAAYGFVYQFSFLGDVAIPTFKGADTMGMHGPVQATIRAGTNMPLLEFSNNEAYGAMQGGFTYWWVSSRDPVPYETGQETVIKDLKLWHIYNKTIYHYPSQKITFDGLKIRGNWTPESRCCGHGVYFSDYSAKNIIIRNSDIQGVRIGIEAPVAGFGPGPNLLVENTYLRNDINLIVGTNRSVNGCWMQDNLIELRNTRLDVAPGGTSSMIMMARGNGIGEECLSPLDELRVYAYNGNAADNFQVYHIDDSVLPRPPSGCTPVTREGIIDGLTCPLAAVVGPGLISHPVAGSTLTSETQLFEWSPGVGVSGYRLAVGTSRGANDIYSGAAGTSLFETVGGLPTAGGEVWVRLYSNVEGSWQYVDYRYMAAGAPLFFDLSPGNKVVAFGFATQTTPPFNVAAGDLIVAFVAAAGQPTGGQTMTVSGGSLPWTLVERSNGKLGVSEIWKAKSPNALSGITVTSTPNEGEPIQSLVVVRFSGAGGTGATAAASGASGEPTVSLTTTQTGSLVYAVGNDWSGEMPRTIGPNQTMVHESFNPLHDTFWVQRLNGTVPLPGTLVTLNDAEPIDVIPHMWNFAAVEILPMQRIAPTITWPTPADVVYGTPLDGAQLNATTTVAGTFVYTPPADTILGAGLGQTLSVTFSPADTTRIYGPATATVPLNVIKATPVITWSAPAEVGLGTPLSATQLNATANVPGTFAYTPAAGTVLAAGVGQTLLVTFTPTDATNYAPATKSVAITVNGVPSIAVSATSVAAAAVVTATVANGPGNRTDWVALHATGGSTYLDWKYLNASQVAPAAGMTGAAVPFTMPTTPGTYTLRLYTGSTLLATSATVTVVGPAVALSTTTVTVGGIVSATVSNGPGNAKDWLGVYATGGSTLFDWRYLNGSQTAPATGVSTATVDLTMPTTPGTYAVRLYNGSLLATSAVITVGAAISPTVIASATSVVPGGAVTATVANGPGNARDWVGVSATGESTYLDWKYLNGTQVAPTTGLTGAALPFTLPITAGTYVLRFYAGSTLLATSAVITVATPTNTTVTVNTTTAPPGATVTAVIANAPGIRTDWIALHPEGASTYLTWKYLNGSQSAPATGLTAAAVDITLPAMPGTYTVRLYTGSTLLATSEPLTVATASSIALNATTIAPGGTVAATVANGPGNRTDWVALYATGSSTYLVWKYLNASQVAPAVGMTGGIVPFAMPTVPGTYTVRFFTGSTLMATSPTITVGFTTTLTISTTTVSPGGTLAATVGNGPGNSRDWVGLYPASGSTLLEWRYLSGSQTPPAQGLTGATVNIVMPTTPGSYTLRFATGSLILATSPTVIVQ